MKIKTKLTVAFLVCGLTPLAIATAISYINSNKSLIDISTQGKVALEEGAHNQLVTMRDMKQKQVENYFAERQGDMGVLMETVSTLRTEAFSKLQALQEIKKDQIETYFEGLMLDMETFGRSQDVTELFAALKQYHIDTDTQPDGPYDVTTPEYKAIWNEKGANILQYYQESGVYDVFMVCSSHGHVMYSAAKKSDLGENMRHGSLNDSGLAHLWNKIKSKNGKAFVDFEPYAPSNGDPSAFAGAPVRDENGKMYGMMIVQVPLDQINDIMNKRTGLGDTGETYLVGPDKLMRSDSFLDPTNHSVKASFANPTKGAVDTEAVREALSGQTGQKVINDYNGNPVLSCYSSIAIEDLSWAILAEMDVSEAFCPKDKSGTYFFEKYSNIYGYYDLFLINPDGFCFYSVCQEADYNTNFVNGKYADSGLGKAVRECLKTGEFAFGDFAPYAPSGGIPAAFVAQPVLVDGNADLIVALQLSGAAINGMMASGSDKERTLEAYLVGPDGHMRSDSILNPDGYTIAASFGQGNKVNTDASSGALNGNTDAQVITDYLGSPVLSAWAPLNIYGTNWALICEIDEAVAMEAVAAMDETGSRATAAIVTWSLGILIVAGIATAIAGVLIATGLSKPINRMVDMLKDIAQGEGDLTKRVDQDRKDELGDMGKWFNTFVLKIHDIIADVRRSAGEVAAAATQIAATSEEMSAGTSEQTRQIDQVSAAVEEMSSSVTEVAGRSAEVATHAKDAGANASTGGEVVSNTVAEIETIAMQVDESSQSVNTLGEKSEQIGEIIEVINDIADQTNLLALNAAIEAARAGEHGRGFAVVADEVRKLAERTQKATEEVGSSITEIQNVTKTSVERMEASRKQVQSGVDLAKEAGSSLKLIVTGSDKVTSGITDIAAACEQQSAAAEEVSRSVYEISAVVKESAQSASQSAAAASQLSGNAEQLQAMVGQFKLNETPR